MFCDGLEEILDTHVRERLRVSRNSFGLREFQEEFQDPHVWREILGIPGHPCWQILDVGRSWTPMFVKD